jgi:pyrroline-5-carboxylate reductase
MTQFQNSTIDVIRNELKSKREMFAPATVVTRLGKLKQPLLSSQRMVGFVCTKPNSFANFLQKATSCAQLAALMSSASVVEVAKTLATLDRQCTKALLHIM